MAAPPHVTRLPPPTPLSSAALAGVSAAKTPHLARLGSPRPQATGSGIRGYDSAHGAPGVPPPAGYGGNPIRTVSYQEALHAAQLSRRPDEGNVPERLELDGESYAAGNLCSADFFERMKQSTCEAERLQQQCRAAAGLSLARGPEEKVSMNHIRKTINSARGVSSFAGSLVVKAGRKPAVGDHVMVTATGRVGKVESVNHEDALCGFRVGGLDVPRSAHDRDVQVLMDRSGSRVHDELPLDLQGEPSQVGLPEGAPLWLGHLLRPKEVQEQSWRDIGKAAPKLPRVASASKSRPDSAPTTAPPTAPATRGEVSTRGEMGMSGMSPDFGASGASKSATHEGNRPGSGNSREVVAKSGGLKIQSPNDSKGRGPSKESGFSSDSNDGKSKDASAKKESEASDSSSESAEGSEYSSTNPWPPKPPLLKFKMCCQFSSRFKPTENKELFAEQNRDLQDKIVERTEEMKDSVLGWLNLVFELDIITETHFEVGFPIVILVMLDSIYPRRVRWREVDWRFQYKRALTKNYASVEAIWAEVNMEKAREFRVENTPLRLEAMSQAPVREKIEFVKLMKRWFDSRVHAAGHFDPMLKRQEFVKQCSNSGVFVKFPSWIKYEAPDENNPRTEPLTAEQIAYFELPEFKRLTWFLGSTEHQTM